MQPWEMYGMAPQQPWQMLMQQPRPVDTVRNPDFDAAMGLSPSSTDSPAESLMKGFQSAMARNTIPGQELTMDIARAKMANQMQIDLMQRKLELERQYPEYQAHPTQWGSVLMVNPYNPSDNTEIGGAAGAREAYEAKLKAGLVENQEAVQPDVVAAKHSAALLAPQVEQSKINEAQASADYHKGALSLAQAARANLANAKAAQAQNVSLTPAENKEIETNAYRAAGIGDLQLKIGGPKVAAVQAQIQQAKADALAKKRGQAASQSSAAPQGTDINSILNLGNGLPNYNTPGIFDVQQPQQ